MTRRKKKEHVDIPSGDARDKEAQLGDVGETEVVEPEEADPLTVLAIERDEFRDKFLRARADLENYRKRAAREMEDVRRYGIAPFALAMLQVRDDLDRTLAACTDTEAHKTLLEGLKLVRDQFDKILAAFSISSIKACGKPFDPNLHEAMVMETTDEVPPNTVVEEFQTGFMLRDRLIRPAKVKVAQAAPRQEADKGGDGS